MRKARRGGVLLAAYVRPDTRCMKRLSTHGTWVCPITGLACGWWRFTGTASMPRPVGRSLSSRCLQLLTLWLRVELPLVRLPCSLFGEKSKTADAARMSFISSHRTILTTAAVKACNPGILATAARALALPGGTADLLLDTLPEVLAYLLPMRNSHLCAERDACTCSLEFVCQQLEPQPLHLCIKPRLQELIYSLLVCSASRACPQDQSRPS